MPPTMLRSYEGLDSALGVETWQRIAQAITEMQTPEELAPAALAIKLTKAGYMKWW